MYQRDLTKNEAGILPDAGSTIVISKPKSKTESEVNPYEHTINSRLKADSHGMQKISFAAKETFEQALILSQKIPRWKTNSENPINNFVPPSTTTYISESDQVLEER